jgi:hypothetical protein
VEAAQTQSRKNMIFAWFENKAAAMAWYNSPAHKFLRRSAAAAGAAGDHEPMAGVPEDVPVLAVASLKMAGAGEKPLPGMPMPVTEISIELYTPLPGGIRYGGGFAPEALKVEGRTDISAPAAPDAPPVEPTGAETPKPAGAPAPK